MDWIKAIIQKHQKEDGSVDLDAANAEIDKQFPQHAVTKSVYNTKAKEAAETKTALEDLQADSAALEDLKQERDKLQGELQTTKVNYQTETALKEAGGKNIDFLIYKLGDLELDEDGKVKDLDSKIEELKQDQADFFEAPETGEEGGDGEEGSDENGGSDEGGTDGAGKEKLPNGYRVDDNKLQEGGANESAMAISEFERSVGIQTPKD